MGKVAIGKTVLFGLDQELIRKSPPLVLEDFFFELHKFLHLLDEPGLDVGLLVKGSNAALLFAGLHT